MAHDRIICACNWMTNEIEIGYTGSTMYTINRLELQIAIWNREVEDTEESVLKYLIKQSQYVDFEEVKNLENDAFSRENTKISLLK